MSANSGSHQPHPTTVSSSSNENNSSVRKKRVRFPLLANQQKEYRARVEQRMEGNILESKELQLKNQLERELELYWKIPMADDDDSMNEAEDPNNSLNFWLAQSNYLPFLSKVAMTIVTTPASSGAAEREFSKAGWLCSGRRNRLTGESLQSEVLLTCNLHTSW